MGFVLGVLNPHVVEIGSVVIHWYGIIIAAGILVASPVEHQGSKKKGLEEDTIIDMALSGNSDRTPRRSALLCVI